jgi:hypothetical protein
VVLTALQLPPAAAAMAIAAASTFVGISTINLLHIPARSRLANFRKGPFWDWLQLFCESSFAG